MNDQIIMYGTTHCEDCIRSKALLDQHNISYKFINIEENEEAAKKVIAIDNGSRSTPTLIFPDGSILTKPSNIELAEKLGIGS